MMTAIRRPNFFIVGAPKSGTTALDAYLRGHPDIFMAPSKDVNHFGSDLQFRRGALRDTTSYEGLFRGVTDQARVGESSVWYLYSRLAAHEIRAYSRDPRIIVMLREPSEMLYSQHSEFLYNGNEDIRDFEEALDAEPDRRRGRRIPRSAHFVEGLFYRATVDYAAQLERYFAVFPRDRVHVIIYDDFRRDVAGVFRETLAFLGVDPDYKLEQFPVVNPNKQTRSRWLRDAFRERPGYIRVAGRLVPQSIRHAMRRRLRQLNVAYKPRPPLDHRVKDRLRQEFAPRVQALEEILDRDLSHWYDGRW